MSESSDISRRRKLLGGLVGGLMVTAAWIQVYQQAPPAELIDPSEPEEATENPSESKEATVPAVAPATPMEARQTTGVPHPPITSNDDAIEQPEPPTSTHSADDPTLAGILGAALKAARPPTDRCLAAGSPVWPSIDAGLSLSLQLGPAGLEWIEVLDHDAVPSMVLECLGHLYDSDWIRVQTEHHQVLDFTHQRPSEQPD